MRTRVLSSIFVVVAGLVPTLIGGPIFALFMVALGLAGFWEYVALSSHVGGRNDTVTLGIGTLVVVAMGLAALAGSGVPALFTILAFAVASPLLAQLPRTADPRSMASWSLASSGSLYVGLPVYAAIALRSLPGPVDVNVFSGLANSFALGWDHAPLGLAWTLMTIVATWVGDSAAYLVGRAVGSRKLAPDISPGKTIEGSLGGLVGAAAIGAIAFTVFGIGSWPFGLATGLIIGIAGQFGDLCESFMKRQASIKDSGQLIPGHGGILDRIDALLFAFPIALVLASGLNRLGLT
jgi:phosphatidate cytidylyltransferase